MNQEKPKNQSKPGDGHDKPHNWDKQQREQEKQKWRRQDIKKVTNTRTRRISGHRPG